MVAEPLGDERAARHDAELLRAGVVERRPGEQAAKLRATDNRLGEPGE